jgi:hypothetical protein
VEAVIRSVTLPIRWIDRALLAHYDIFEFTDDPLCILRAGLTPSPSAVSLQDGTSIDVGETVGELHLWSERSMTIHNGVELRRRMTRSFAEFAKFAARDPRFASIDAVIVRTSACDQFPRSLIEKLAARWGFEIEEHRRSLRERFADFWVNIYNALLGQAYRSGPLRLRRRLERLRIWISRKRLMELHLPRSG